MPAPISFRLLSGICPVCAVDIKTQCISNNDDLVGRFRPRFLALLLHQRIDGRGRMDITTIRKGKTVAWLKRPERSAQCAWPCGFVVQGYLTGLPVAGRCNGRLQRQQHRCLGGRVSRLLNRRNTYGACVLADTSNKVPRYRTHRDFSDKYPQVLSVSIDELAKLTEKPGGIVPGSK